jgi:hypothetical protein
MGRKQRMGNRRRKAKAREQAAEVDPGNGTQWSARPAIEG